MNTETMPDEIKERQNEITSLRFNYKITETEKEKEISRLNRQIADLQRIHIAILDRNERRKRNNLNHVQEQIINNH